MKKRNLFSGLAVFTILSVAMTTTCYAASIFNETMDTFSYSRYLPIVVGGTMLIEAAVILLMSDIKRIVNVSYTVFVANIASFFIPRFVWGVAHKHVFFSDIFVFDSSPDKWLAAAILLGVSLVIELPIVYFMLRIFTQKIARLLLSAAAANVITSLATVLFEIYLYNSLIK